MRKLILSKWAKVSYAISAIAFLFGIAATPSNRPLGVSLATCALAFGLFTAVVNGHIKTGNPDV